VIEKITIGRRARIDRAQQIRDVLNTFVSFITILRNSDRFLCLDRIETNPLEDTFGKAPMRCLDVNTMKRLIGAFRSDALTHAVDLCLDLSIVARHRVSVGVDCPPYSRIERSIFDSRAKQIAGSLFTQTGTDLTRLRFGVRQISELEPQSWHELYRIPEFVTQSHAIGEGDFANLARVTKRRTLSSDRIFIVVIASPRFVYLMSTPRTLASVLDIILKEVETGLMSIFRRWLNARELDLRVGVLAMHLNQPPPEGKAAACMLQWLHANWSESGHVLLREFMGHSELLVPDNP
jgi:hypothetical protein